MYKTVRFSNVAWMFPGYTGFNYQAVNGLVVVTGTCIQDGYRYVLLSVLPEHFIL